MFTQMMDGNICFVLQEIIKEKQPLLLKLGLVVDTSFSRPAPGDPVYVSFPHTRMQEFVAAKYLAGKLLQHDYTVSTDLCPFLIT